MSKPLQLHERVTRHAATPQSGELLLGRYEMITSIDARGLFERFPTMELLFVYVGSNDESDLRVCFQRCAMKIPKPMTLTKEDLTMT